MTTEMLTIRHRYDLSVHVLCNASQKHKSFANSKLRINFFLFIFLEWILDPLFAEQICDTTSLLNIKSLRCPIIITAKCPTFIFALFKKKKYFLTLTSSCAHATDEFISITSVSLTAAAEEIKKKQKTQQSHGIARNCNRIMVELSTHSRENCWNQLSQVNIYVECW